MVIRIYKGYEIEAHGKIYLVVGSRSLRGDYKYIIRGTDGINKSILRSELLKGQELGTIRVIGETEESKRDRAEAFATRFILEHGHTGTL